MPEWWHNSASPQFYLPDKSFHSGSESDKVAPSDQQRRATYYLSPRLLIVRVACDKNPIWCCSSKSVDGDRIVSSCIFLWDQIVAVPARTGNKPAISGDISR